MPKLPKKKAQSVAQQEGSDFEALPEGTYVGQLVSVKVSDKPGPSGAHYWTWEFDVVEPEEHKNRKLFVNTSLSDEAEWKMKEMFDAFGYSTDSDTDEMVGEQIKLAVSQRVIEQGSRKGQIGNNVDRCMPMGEGEGGEEGDDVF